jgi:hypothetical protein
MSFDRDFKWQRQFIPEMKRILAQYLIEEAPFEEDAHRNTDLLVLEAKTIRIACRVRQYQYAARYGDEFTIRASRPSGVETELHKVLRGWGDRLFYGFATADESGLCAWVLGDLNEFRLWHNHELARLPAGQIPGALVRNHDGSSTGRAYNINRLPPDFVVARKRFVAQEAA